jgi:hypothetical protein
MSERIQFAKDKKAADISDDAVGAAPAGDGDLQRFCKGFVEALGLCADMKDETSSERETRLTLNPSKEIAYARMEHALHEIRTRRASCATGLRAKSEAFFAAEEWFGKEDHRVAQWALELIREFYEYCS